MHAISSGVFIGFVAVAIVACGGDSQRHSSGVEGNTATTGEAGAGSGDDGGGSDQGGSSHGGSGPGGSGPGGDQGGSSGATPDGGMPGAGGMSGGSTATPSTGTSSTDGTTVTGTGGAGTGGDSTSSGTTNGGASSVSSTGSVDLIEPPPNCESVSQSADADSCAYEYRCDGRTHFDSCTLEIDGSWTCECGTFSTPSRYFEIGGVEALEACSVIARVCEGDVPVSPTTVCRLKETVVDGSTCTSYASCGNELDLGPGIVARAIERRRSVCETLAYPLVANGELECSCVTDTGREDYRVMAPSAGAACEPMLAVCFTGQLPAFTGEVCSQSEPSGIVEQVCPNDPACQGCSMYWTCYATASIAEDVSIIDLNNVESSAVACRPEDGELQCACFDGYLQGVYGDDTVPSSVRDVCRESIEACHP